MSNDELLPVPGLNPSVDSDAPKAGQEPSVQDAPPAGPTRRRRAKATGSDAVSASTPLTTEPSAPARRAQRKPATLEPATAAGNAAATIPAPESAPALPARRRKAAADLPADAGAPPAADAPARPSRRRAAKPAAETDTDLAAETQTGEPVLPEAPASVPRRGRRRASAEPPDAAEPTVPPAPAAEGEPAGEPPVQKPRRGRARRQATAPEPAAPVEINADTSAEARPAAAPGPARGRRRGTRTAQPEPGPAAETTGEPAAEAEEDASTQAARRNRRGGRSKRTRTETSEAVPEAEIVPPEPVEEPIDITIGAHLVVRSGIPEIHIQGQVYPPVLFFGNVEGPKNRAVVLSEVRQAAQAGVHLHSILVELPCPLSEAHHALDEIDDRLRNVLEADPEGYVMPRIVFVPARGWRREYPGDIATYADGTTGDPSLTSERFWQEAERSVTAMIAHLHDYEWGRRIFGYHLERGEWFQPADQGYDRSVANRDAFRDWLREKYQQSLVALRAAWYDGDVQFHTAEIPAALAKPDPQRAFYQTRRERFYIDFNEFTSESTARRLIALARAVKKAVNGQALTSVCYGYTLEFGHTFSGHLALSTLEAAPSIDLICGPPSYRDRKPGGGASFPAPTESLPLHGKLWLSEDDTKTYLAPSEQDPEDFNPRLPDRAATEQAQDRAIGRTLAHTSAIGFMDLWGEGWLDDPAIWERLGAFTAQYGKFRRQRQYARVPEVVALIDEKSLLHVQRGETFLRQITNGLRDCLQRAGVSYGIYLQNDVLAEGFPTDSRLYLFLTPYRLTGEQRAAIKDKLHGGDRTLAWLYAPGTCEERPSLGGAMEEAATNAIGIALRQQEWNSEVGSRIVDVRHTVTQGLVGRELGVRERLNPSLFVDDPDAAVLAEYIGSGLASIAVKQLDGWKSVFVGEPALPIELLRGICRYAGVHVWTSLGDDITEIGNGWVTVHATRDGQRTLRLPDTVSLYDVTAGRFVADEAREYRFFMRAGATSTFCVGSIERFESLGLPNLPESGAIRTPAVPPLPSPAREPRRQTETPSGPALNSDLEIFQAVLAMDVSEHEVADIVDDPYLAALESDALVDSEPATGGLDPTGEVIADGRRRRRRGGRGRGRRVAGEGEGEAGGAGGERTAGGGEDRAEDTGNSFG